jgi:hypothetical protein
MENSRHSPRADDERAHPRPDTVAAAAAAPPPRSPRALGLFLATLVLIVCGVAGVLLLFTAVPVGYAVVLLALASVAAVCLGMLLRRGASRGSR